MTPLGEYRAALRQALARWPDSDWPDEVDGRLDALWRAMTAPEREAARAYAASLNGPRRTPVDREMVAASREAFARGAGEDVRDVIARLEAGGPLVEGE